MKNGEIGRFAIALLRPILFFLCRFFLAKALIRLFVILFSGMER